MKLPAIRPRSIAAWRLCLLLWGLWAGTVSAGQPENAPPGSYARALYDVYLVETCGLLTGEVQRGFELARDERRQAEQLDDAAARTARISAGIAFDLEQQNRGLGGSRPWCRQDGRAAALAFFARFIDERYPKP